MSTISAPSPEAPEALPEAPTRRAPGPRERVAAHALAADIARLHGDALLRTATRFSACAEDAHDAYQRAMELLLDHAPTIDRAKAVAWMHVVVRREAGLLRRAHRTVPLDAGVDGAIDRLSAAPDDQVHAIDLAQRAGEALANLNETQAQALCLRAQGLSYDEIADAYGWSYTKVNRAVTEGRRAFVAHYRAVENGIVCGDTAALLSRFVAGDLKARLTVKMRAHLVRCTACRADLHAFREADTALHALLPPVAVAGTGVGTTTPWLHDHLLAPLSHLAGRLQPAVDHLAGSKIGLAAASSVALAGGGVAVEQRVNPPAPPPAIRTTLAADTTAEAATPAGATVARVVTTAAERSDALAAARKRAAAKKKTTARKAARNAAAARAAAQREFAPADGEFATTTRDSTARAQRSTGAPASAASAPTTEVQVADETTAPTVDVAPDTPSAAAPPSGAVDEEFGP